MIELLLLIALVWFGSITFKGLARYVDALAFWMWASPLNAKISRRWYERNRWRIEAMKEARAAGRPWRHLMHAKPPQATE